MKLRYDIDDRPPVMALLLYAVQWLAVSIPSLVILAQVMSALQPDAGATSSNYLQMLLVVTGAAQVLQIIYGHRLPLVLGPAAVLLVGTLASSSAAPGAVPAAMFTGGCVMLLASVTGLFQPLQRLFTPQVVAVVLLLIAFTLLPTIRDLVLNPADPDVSAPTCLGFCLVLLLVLFVLHRALRGVWKSTLVIWGMLGGTAVWSMLSANRFAPGGAIIAVPLREAGFEFVFDPGVVISFLICYMVLAINDIGSIQSLEHLLHPGDMSRRLQRGLNVTALANMVSGLVGVLGPVNYSMSPGVIAVSRCASRWTLVPAGVGMLICGLSPRLTAIFSAVPAPVIGTILLYVLCAQVATGLLVIYQQDAEVCYEHGLSVGLALLVGTSVAYLPATVVNTLPAILRPMLGNGFVVGVVLCLVLEHLVFPQSPQTHRS